MIKVRGSWRYLIAVVAAAAAIGAVFIARSKHRTAGVVSGPIEVMASPIRAFNPTHPEERRFGALEFRGGLVLTSSSKHFGGWSALAVDDAGHRLLSISDTGVWLTGELTYEEGRPVGIREARLGALLEGPGQPIHRKRDQDSEGVALTSGTIDRGEVLISFEHNHRIGRFPVSRQEVGAPLEFLSLPAEVGRLEDNKSLESVCQLKGGANAGAVVTLAERFPSEDGQHRGWLQQGSGWRSLMISNVDGYDLTDCHGLAGGGMLVLERRYRWRDLLDGVHMRLRYFSAEEIQSGRLMQGEVLVDAGPDREIDNMEGLAVSVGSNGETIISMISDDNFNHGVQRTVLLQFAWRRGETLVQERTSK